MIYRLVVAALLVLVCVVTAGAQQTHNTVPSSTASFITDLQTYLLNEDPNRFKEFFGGIYTISGGTHGTGAGLTKTPTALLAYPGGYYATESGSIVYQDNATCWVVATYTTTSALTGNFVRVAGTKYAIDCVTASQPTQPANSVYLMKVVTAAGAVTTVTDLRQFTPFITPGTMSLNSFTLLGASNGVTLLTAKRFTDTSPTGNFETFQNAAAGTLWNVDINGKLTTGTIATSTAGPHSIGGVGSNANIQFYMTGPFTHTLGSFVAGMHADSVLTAIANDTAYGISVNPTINKATSGTHPDFIGLRVGAFAIGAGASTLTNASSLKIEGAPSVGTNKYGLWNVGNSRFDSGVSIGSGTTATGSGLIVGAVTDKGAGTVNISGGYFASGTFILRGYLAGLTLSNDGGAPNTVIDTSAGVAASDDQTVMMALAAFTKSTSAWAVGTGNGCLDTGAIAAATWYHVFVIERTDTQVVDELCSLSVSAPTMPASYTKKRRIGSFKTDGSSNIIAFVQDGDYFRWTVAVLDVNVNNPGATAVLRTLTVPTGLKVIAMMNRFLQSAPSVGNVGCYISDPASTDQAPSTTAAPLTDVLSNANADGSSRVWERTNTSAQVRTRLTSSDANTNFRVATLGWFDRRGQDD